MVFYDTTQTFVAIVCVVVVKAKKLRENELTRVHIIGTGGTIASQPESASRSNDLDDSTSGAVASVGIADIIGATSVEGDLEVSSEDLLLTGSYALDMSQILMIVDQIQNRIKDPHINAVVVTHGTDTMEETAFLSELVNDGSKAVIFTGAQRSAEHADTDGPRNLRQAILAAADPRVSSMGALVCFDGVVQSARGVRKSHTTASQPFSGGATVATFHDNRLEMVATPDRRSTLALPANGFGSVRIDVHFAYPGSDSGELIKAARGGANAVVLAGTGVGNAGHGYVEAVMHLTDMGVPVVLASRAPSGPVVPIYGNGGGVDLIAAGAVSAGVLSPFQARILAACLITQEVSVSEFKELFSSYR